MLFQGFRVKFSISFFYFIEPGKYGFLSSGASNDYTEQTRKLWARSAHLTGCGRHRGSGMCVCAVSTWHPNAVGDQTLYF